MFTDTDSQQANIVTHREFKKYVSHALFAVLIVPILEAIMILVYELAKSNSYHARMMPPQISVWTNEGNESTLPGARTDGNRERSYFQPFPIWRFPFTLYEVLVKSRSFLS